MSREHHICIQSPVGPLGIRSDGEAITQIDFGATRAGGSGEPGQTDDPGGPGQGREGRVVGAGLGMSAVLDAAVFQLGEYFAGQRRLFDLPLALCGTPFQRQVWEQLALLPFGETTTYGALARAIGRPRAVRAVGAANGRNPLPIVLPCHRVVGSDGSLTGFGGGLPIKRWLLVHEGWTLVGDRLRTSAAGQAFLPLSPGRR